MAQTLAQEVTEAQLQEFDVVCVFGAADPAWMGRLAPWLKSHKERFLVFLESNEQRFLQAKQSPLAEHLQVRLFCVSSSQEELLKEIAWEFVFLRFLYLPSFPEERESSQECFKLLEYYRRGVNLLASDSEDLGVRVLSNALRNLENLPSSLLGMSLEGKCAGDVAFICGAGPSLNLSAPLLREVQDKALIFAAGSALRALEIQGVTPHFGAALDPEPSYTRFLQQEGFEVPLFYQSRFSHKCLSQAHGPLLWMPSTGNHPLESYLAAECGIFSEPFDAGWTVANFCIALAAHLGCTTLILVGMDWSCGPNEVYASGLSGKEHEGKLIALKQEGLYSRQDWLMSAEWTRVFMDKHPTISWKTASVRGAQLLGIEASSLEEIKNFLPSISEDRKGKVHALIAQATPTAVKDFQVRELKKTVKKSFEKGLSLCDQLLAVWGKYHPRSPLEQPDYVLLEQDLEQEICMRRVLIPLWATWRHSMTRVTTHPLGKQLHRLLFFKQAIEAHLSYMQEGA